jgi:hypothetical protein
MFPLYQIAFRSGAKKHLSDTECTTFRSWAKQHLSVAIISVKIAFLKDRDMCFFSHVATETINVMLATTLGMLFQMLDEAFLLRDLGNSSF